MGQNHPRGNQSVHQAKHSKFNKVAYPIKLFDKEAETMVVELPSDQTSYKKWKQDLKLYEKQFSNKKYLLLPQQHDYHNGGMCSQSGIAKITYPKLPYILEDEIQTTKNKKNTFSEAEIWKLLHVLVEAKKEYLQFAKTFSYELGNVNPKHIFLNQHNEIKLANPLSWPNYIDGYKNAVLREPAYLAPEDVKLLDLGALNNDANGKSEDFSIGMTLLSAGLVENLQHLYNFNKPSFNSKQFQEKLILWKTTLYYSQILRAVVLSFLQTDQENRLSFNQAREFLKPHVANIQASRPLVISAVNPKIQRKVDKLIKQLPDLIKYRFEKYSPEKQRQVRGQKSLTKESKNNSLPKETKLSQLQKNPIEVRKNENSREGIINQIKNEKFQPILPPGSQFQIGRAVQQMIQPGTIQASPITRVKSQTRFTYSNRPLENVSPTKFVINGQNGVVTQQPVGNSQTITVTNKIKPILQPVASNYEFRPHIQDTGFRPSKYMVSSPRVNKITYESNPEQQTVRPTKEPSLIVSTDHMLESRKPTNTTVLTPAQKQAEEIAQRLVKQGLKHTDSEIHVQQSNRESASTQINKLELLQAVNTLNIVPFKTQTHDKNHISYHTYEQILVNSDFGSVWNEFLNLIHHPETYFEELQQKITVSDQTIQIPPGKVKIETNKEEGKIHLQNVSSKCTGEILGGVSKKSPEEVQVWFNSSYKHDGKPFPTSEYFLKGLQKLKHKVETKKTQ